MVLDVLVALAGSSSGQAAPAGAPPAVTEDPGFRAGLLRTGAFPGKGVTKLTGTRWKVATGGPVHSSPVIAGGVVYVGSNDGNVHAVEAKTGKPAWKFETGGAVGSSPALADGVLVVGSEDGTVYALE